MITKFYILFLFCLSRRIECEETQLYGEIFSENTRNLFLHRENVALTHQHKCLQEVPAIFFQTSKADVVRGNGSTIYYHRIEVCCKGYVRSPYDWQRCVPDCSEVSPSNCLNGFCRGPNQCECFEEFVRNDRGECVHTCPIQCDYGKCFLDGTCVCRPGYALDPITRKFCRPECPQVCGTNQECVSPGKCGCKTGYRATSEFGCQPICTPDCGYGKCIGPNQCECFAGYTKRPQRNVCEASCYINCENGFCESHYKCLCRDGYTYDPQTTSCLPECGDQCQNGVCVAPGVCKCFEGYETRWGSCEPICYGGCGYYGHCIDINICACGSSKQRCLLGVCDGRGRCNCKPDHIHFIDRCIEPSKLMDMVNTYEHREHFNEQLKIEFDGLIGRMFQFKE